MNKILVTGGTGFIGAALVNRLVKEGYHVRSFDNNSRGHSDRLKGSPKLETVQGDIRDLKSVIAAAEGCDSVIHLAYVNGTQYFYSKPDLVLDVAVKGMVNILEASKLASIKNFILASSSEVYQSAEIIPTPESVALVVPDVKNPRYSYGGGKILCELMALHQAANFIPRVFIFRPHNVYGPQMGFEHVIPQFVEKGFRLLKGKSGQLSAGDALASDNMPRRGFASDSGEELVPFPIQGSGLQTRSFIYIDDFVDGILLLCAKGQHSEIYHIGTREEVSMRSLAERVAAELSLPIQIISEPEAKGGTMRRLPDISKMESLGFKPQISLESGLKTTVAWYANYWRSHDK